MTFPNILADVLASVGVLAIITGTYLEFGTGYAVIVGGILIAALGANLARLLNATHHDED